MLLASDVFVARPRADGLSCCWLLTCLSRTAPPGNILNGLSARQDVMAVVSRQCVLYCWLAIGAGAAGFLQAWGFSLLSERLSNRTRRAYLEALLATEVGYYDVASSGELVNRLSENIVLLNLALAPKMGVLLQAISTFLAGLVVGLYQGWRLALVLLGFVPLLAGVGAARFLAVGRGLDAGHRATEQVVEFQRFHQVGVPDHAAVRNL
jgi:ABC-type multidrug transport system fused ATPase/permease subunit